MQRRGRWSSLAFDGLELSEALEAEEGEAVLATGGAIPVGGTFEGSPPRITDAHGGHFQGVAGGVDVAADEAVAVARRTGVEEVDEAEGAPLSELFEDLCSAGHATKAGDDEDGGVGVVDATLGQVGGRGVSKRGPVLCGDRHDPILSFLD